MSMRGPDARGWPGDDLEVPPHSLDLDAIVQVGRRQVRHRRMAMVGGTAAVLAAVAAIPATMALRPSSGGGADIDGPSSTPPLPVLDCDITELPLPEEYADPGPGIVRDVILQAMDPTGRYAVGDAYLQSYAGNESDPDGVVLWEDGRPTAPSPLRGVTEASDVNADGVVVGGGEGSGYAWIYRDGQVSRLPTPDGYDSAEASAINAAGDVAGSATYGDDRKTMVVWPADDLDNPRVLAVPPGRAVPAGGIIQISASGITDDGVVVGRYFWDRTGEGPADTGVYLWEPDGTLVELPVPEGAYDVYGVAVRGNWAIGQALTEPEGPATSPTPPPTGTSVSLRWDLSTHTLQRVSESGGVPNQVWDVNAAGDLLFIAPPAVIRGGEAYALPNPIEEGAVTPPDAAYTPEVGVTAISDDGSTIAGDIYFNILPAPVTRLVHPVLWRC